MPFVHVFALAGASDEQKERLVAGVTDAICRAYAIGPDIVTLYLNEIPLSNYGHGGRVGAAARPAPSTRCAAGRR
jgi:4-oxalocrotonate tautomerase